jgi:hypothetical protein
MTLPHGEIQPIGIERPEHSRIRRETASFVERVNAID